MTHAMLKRMGELMVQEPYLSMRFGRAWKLVEERTRWEFGMKALWFWEVY